MVHQARTPAPRPRARCAATPSPGMPARRQAPPPPRRPQSHSPASPRAASRRRGRRAARMRRRTRRPRARCGPRGTANAAATAPRASSAARRHRIGGRSLAPADGSPALTVFAACCKPWQERLPTATEVFLFAMHCNVTNRHPLCYSACAAAGACASVAACAAEHGRKCAPPHTAATRASAAARCQACAQAAPSRWPAGAPAWLPLGCAAAPPRAPAPRRNLGTASALHPSMCHAVHQLLILSFACQGLHHHGAALVTVRCKIRIMKGELHEGSDSP